MTSANHTSITIDDPRLTAFALGELDGDVATTVAVAVQNDPALAAEVSAIRAMADQLGSALNDSGAKDSELGAQDDGPLPRLSDTARAAIRAAHDEGAGATGKRPLRLLPLVGAGTLAAAGVLMAVIANTGAMHAFRAAVTTLVATPVTIPVTASYRWSCHRFRRSAGSGGARWSGRVGEDAEGVYYGVVGGNDGRGYVPS